MSAMAVGSLVFLSIHQLIPSFVPVAFGTYLLTLLLVNVLLFYAT